MRTLKTAAALTIATLAISGCGDSQRKPEQKRGAGAVRSAFLHRALQLARASDSELSIFPGRYSHAKCLIPRAVGGVHTPLKPLAGTCQTRFESTIDARESRTKVIFTERWAWPPCSIGEDCIAKQLRHHTWLVTVKRPVGAAQKPRVVAMHQTGAQAPQAPKP